MQKFFPTIFILCLSFFVQAETAPSAAQQTGKTKFVSDQLTIMLRSGPSNKHKIIRALSTGTQLHAFESQGEFEHVRTHSGMEGWVLSQHLTDKPLAKHKLTEANDKLSQLTTQNGQLQEQIRQLRDSYNQLKEDYRILDKTKGEMEEELTHIRSIAAAPLQLSNEKQQLSLQTKTLESQVNSLERELNSLRDNTHKQWFLSGAAVVLLGIFIGLTIPKLRRHRRSDWSNI
ncbi:TIGR04211 family SH3 domain-containing protein [Kaarinaea lacus]